MDLTDARKRAATASRRLTARGLEVFKVSGVTHEGMPALLTALRVTLEELGAREDEEESDAAFVYTVRPDPNRFTVERKRGTFNVHGRTAERMVSMTDMDSRDGVERLQRQLKRIGVFQALEEEGIRAGNLVRIGPYELVWAGELEPGLAKPGDGQTAPGSRHQSRKGTRASQERHRG